MSDEPLWRMPVTEFNNTYPVGSEFIYRSMPHHEMEVVRTRSKAKQHEALGRCVKLQGVFGWIPIGNLNHPTDT